MVTQSASQHAEYYGDRFPNLVTLGLEFTRPNNILRRNQIVPKLSILFVDEHWIDLPSGMGGRKRRVRIGLKSVKLILDIEGGGISVSDRKMAGTFELCLDQEIQRSEGSESTGEASLEASPRSASLKFRQQNTSSSSEIVSFKRSQCQVKAGGDSEKPFWVFEAKLEPVLIGLLQDKDLGILRVSSKSCKVTATLEVESYKDSLCIRSEEGVWTIGLSKKKEETIKKVLINFLFSVDCPGYKKLSPFLSKVRWNHG